MNTMLALLAASMLQAAPPANLDCTLHFQSKAWSAVYARVEGTGTIECSDGSRADVSIHARGVGLSLGKWKIEKGTGKFMSVTSIDETLGHYAALSADAGAGKSGGAAMLMKQHVGLALAGKGEGFDLGVSISDFVIERTAPEAQAPTDR